ncbi:MAG: hypothetical protein E6Q33_11045 [Neisseriales bacterium]|nr:MAG: hypothetical protein E6Q33_11045 [Neisseriales bacterium]
MNRDIASLNCGHTFHHECITQHFEYRSSCPYCQKRAMLKVKHCKMKGNQTNNISSHKK